MIENTNKIELMPTNNQKSFYGKAQIENDGDFTTLFSYDTPIIKRNNKTGELTKLWNGWTLTTGKHIYAFCGLRKKNLIIYR